MSFCLNVNETIMSNICFPDTVNRLIQALSIHAPPNHSLSGFLVAATSVISKETSTNERRKYFFVGFFVFACFCFVEGFFVWLGF